METIGVRELRQNASVYLRRVAAGERFTITDRGRPVAELGAVSTSARQRLVDDGALVPAALPVTHLGDIEPIASPPGAPSTAEILAGLRDDVDRPE